MRTFELSRSQRVAGPLEEVFAFFANAHNLGLITPPWLNFSIDSNERILMRAGTRIDYTIKMYGIPMRWRSEITRWEPGHLFVDEQRRGPYRSWVHEHRFAVIDSSHTRIDDRVEYSVLGGRLTNKLFIQAQLARIFDFRALKLNEIFNS